MGRAVKGLFNMLPAMIIPASMLGFISAIVRFFAADITLAQAGLTYLAVSLAAPALLLWVFKSREFLISQKPLQAQDIRTA